MMAALCRKIRVPPPSAAGALVGAVRRTRAKPLSTRLSVTAPASEVCRRLAERSPVPVPDGGPDGGVAEVADR